MLWPKTAELTAEREKDEADGEFVHRLLYRVSLLFLGAVSLMGRGSSSDPYQQQQRLSFWRSTKFIVVPAVLKKAFTSFTLLLSA